MFDKTIKYLFFLSVCFIGSPAQAQDHNRPPPLKDIPSSCTVAENSSCTEDLEVYELSSPQKEAAIEDETPDSSEAPEKFKEPAGSQKAAPQESEMSFDTLEQPEMIEKDGYYEVNIEDGGFYAFE